MKNLVIALVLVSFGLIGSVVYFSNKLAVQEEEANALKQELAAEKASVLQANEDNNSVSISLAEKNATIVELKKQLAADAEKTEASSRELADMREELASALRKVEIATSELSGSHDVIDRLNKENEAFSRKAEEMHVKLVDQLKNEIGKQDITIQDMGGKLKLSLSNKILFPSAMTTLTDEGLVVLERLGLILKGLDNKIIRVEGHTDNVKIRYRLKEKFPTNWELSASRATNVVRFLIDTVGLDPKKVYAVGMSKYHPVADNATSEGRSQNRRIEIMLEAEPDVKEVRELQLIADNSSGSEGAAQATDSAALAKLAEPEIIVDETVVASNDSGSEQKSTTVVSAPSESTTKVHSATLDQSSDSAKVEKPFSYSRGRSRSGVGYIWVKKRITDFDTE